MTTLKIGIASYEQMKARTMAVARGVGRSRKPCMSRRGSRPPIAYGSPACPATKEPSVRIVLRNALRA